MVRGALVAILVIVVAVESTVFAFALSTRVIGADGHFRGGLIGFAVHLTLLLLAVAGLRGVARSREAARPV
jgi:hypothetical protein